MAGPSAYPGNDEGSDRGTIYRTPRWVKIVGIIALVVVLVVVIGLVTGHAGPGRHMGH
jgi:hypothetical protein